MDKLSVAADTSALLSLKLSNCLEDALKLFTFCIGLTIKKELKEISKTKDRLGIAAKRILNMVNDHIKLIETNEFEEGELEALKIYRNENLDLLVSDDIKFVKSHQEEAHFSTLLLLVLVKEDIFTKNELIKNLEKIFEKREWNRNNLIYISTISELKEL